MAFKSTPPQPTEAVVCPVQQRLAAYIKSVRLQQMQSVPMQYVTARLLKQLKKQL